MIINSKGATRTVIMLRRHVIKLPACYSWRSFLNGMLSNLDERRFSSMRDPNLCPVLWSDPLGMMVIMPRCKHVTHRGLFEVALHAMRGALPQDFYLSDAKPENFGYLHGRLVKLDYGS